MIFAVGIILGVIAVAVIGYPFLHKGAGVSSVDASFEDEIERQIQQLRKVREEKPEIGGRTLCPKCGAQCDPKDSFCRNCGASLI